MNKIIDSILLIALLLTISLLTGCSTVQHIKTTKVPSIPAFMTQECEPMTYLDEDHKLTLDEFINITIDNSVKYRKCSSLNHVKSMWILEIKKIDESKSNIP